MDTAGSAATATAAPIHRISISVRIHSPTAPADWRSGDRRKALEIRLARDHHWDAEIRIEAVELGLPVIDIDGSATPEDMADDLAAWSRLV